MIRRLAKDWPELRVSLSIQFGRCPARCHDGFHGPTGRVYRSSNRSITLQCTQCGLLWTMTVHQIAKAAQRQADRNPRDPARRHFAATWKEWAACVADTRGRKR
jgi:hypothetical protein